jgi:uncharacterized protein
MESKISFLGTGWGFPPAFSKESRSVEMTSDEQDIFGSLKILLSTGLGERIMQPAYGCELKRMLFEPMDSSFRTYVKELIKTAILYHEPRIRLENISLEASQNDGRLEITLYFYVRNTNSRYNFVFPFYINEGAKSP